MEFTLADDLAQSARLSELTPEQTRLVQSKRRNLLSAVAPLLDQLQAEAGFWVGAELRANVLRSAGESTR